MAGINVIGSAPGPVFSQPQAQNVRLAQLLQQQGSNTSPVGHPLEALSRAGQGIAGALIQKRATKAANQAKIARQQAIAAALGLNPPGGAAGAAGSTAGVPSAGGAPPGGQIASTSGVVPGSGIAPSTPGAPAAPQGSLDAIIQKLIQSGDPGAVDMGLQMRMDQLTQKSKAPNIITDAQGFKRNVDTGQRVFPGVAGKTKLLTPDEEAQKIRLAQAGRTQVTTNVGPQGVDFGDPPKDTVWARDPETGEIILQKDDATGFAAPVAVPVVGGTVAAGQAAAAKSAEAQQAGAEQTAGIVTEDIDRALEKIEKNPVFTTGAGGAILKSIPGTAARDVRALLTTVKANAGFDRLNQMRQASPTGGALGQVSEFENELLQSTIGNLEQSQSDEQLKQNLRRVRNVYDAIINKGIQPGEEAALFSEGEGDRLSPEEAAELLELRKALARP